jgi:hypothetical protein
VNKVDQLKADYIEAVAQWRLMPKFDLFDGAYLSIDDYHAKRRAAFYRIVDARDMLYEHAGAHIALQCKSEAWNRTLPK